MASNSSNEKAVHVLRAYLPGSIWTHSGIRDFVNIEGGFAAAQLISDYIVATEFIRPTGRRAYTCGSAKVPSLWWFTFQQGRVIVRLATTLASAVGSTTVEAGI